MKKKEIIKLAISILIPLVLGTIVGLVSQDNEYIESLERHIIVPNWVFPFVWTILYILMGTWAYFYERDNEEDNLTIYIYYASLIVNLLFAPIIFLANNLVLALIDVIILLGLVGYLFYKSFIVNRRISYLLIPYVAWLVFALVLMIDLVASNVF
jgi:tryptophan-rich sensory protein